MFGGVYPQVGASSVPLTFAAGLEPVLNAHVCACKLKQHQLAIGDGNTSSSVAERKCRSLQTNRDVTM